MKVGTRSLDYSSCGDYRGVLLGLIRGMIGALTIAQVVCRIINCFAVFRVKPLVRCGCCFFTWFKSG